MPDQHVGNGDRPNSPSPQESVGDTKLPMAEKTCSEEQTSDVRAGTRATTASVVFGTTHRSHDIPAMQSQVVDWDEARRLIPGGPDVLAELIEAVQVECVSILAELEEALARQDAKQLRRAAHTLKSSARYFGASRVVDAAFKLEELGRQEALDEAPVGLEELRPLVDMLLSDLENWTKTPRSRTGR